MRKSIVAAAALLLLVSASPSASGDARPDNVIQTVHTNVNVIEGSVGKEKTLDVGVEVFPGPAGSSYSVDYEIVPQTATRGSDFDALVGRGRIVLDGKAKTTIPIKIKGDVFDETNETIRIQLFSAKCTGPGQCDLDSDPNPRPGYVTIADDDGQDTAGPNMDVRNGLANPITDETCDVEVQLEYGMDKNITVDFETEDLEATHPDDYDKTQGTMVLSPGQIRKSLRVPIHSDRKPRGRGDRFVVNFSHPKGATLLKDSAQCSLTDNGEAPSSRRNHRP
jgi:hypothetical protein